MSKSFILVCTAIACTCIVQLQADEYSGDPELLRLAFEPAMSNRDRLATWKGEAEITCSASLRSGFQRKTREKALFVWDRERDSLRYRIDQLERLARDKPEESFRSEAPRFWAGMKTPEIYCDLRPKANHETGSGNVLSIFLSKAMPTGYMPHRFDPFEYLQVREIDGYIQNWGKPRDPNKSKLPFEVCVSRANEEIIVWETTFYQGEESLHFRQEYDLTKGGYLVKKVGRASAQNMLQTIVQDYAKIKGVWVPVSYSKREQPINKDEEIQQEIYEVVKFTRHVINDPIDPKEFTLEALGAVEGIQVNDRIKNDVYKYDVTRDYHIVQ